MAEDNEETTRAAILETLSTLMPRTPALAEDLGGRHSRRPARQNGELAWFPLRARTEDADD